MDWIVNKRNARDCCEYGKQKSVQNIFIYRGSIDVA